MSYCQKLSDTALMTEQCLGYIFFMLCSTKLTRQLSFSTEYQGHTHARRKVHAKITRLVDILVVGQPTLSLSTMLHVPIPHIGGSKSRCWAGDHRESGSSLIRTHTAAVPLVLHQEMPIRGTMRRAMMVAIRAERV